MLFRSWTLDLEALECRSASGSWPVGFDGGALDMLRSGRWDATSQLVARDAELTRTMAALPYLNGF